MKTTSTAVLSLLPILLAGCIVTTRYSGDLTPVSPKPKSVRFYDAVHVDSLQPTFKWQAKDPSQPVDLAIWESVYRGEGMRGHTGSYEAGPLAYSKERIVGSEHRIEKSLSPQTIYFWSIKPSGTENWSKARHDVYSSEFIQSASGLWFAIETPKEK